MHKPEFKIHEPTGILQVYWARANYEPCHVLVEGDIGEDRKPGIWQRAKNTSELYFTCPWCGAIGMSNSTYINHYGIDSVWCSRKPIVGYSNKKGCNRHLSLVYRTKGREREYFSDSY